MLCMCTDLLQKHEKKLKLLEHRAHQILHFNSDNYTEIKIQSVRIHHLDHPAQPNSVHSFNKFTTKPND